MRLHTERDDLRRQDAGGVQQRWQVGDDHRRSLWRPRPSRDVRASRRRLRWGAERLYWWRRRRSDPMGIAVLVCCDPQRCSQCWRGRRGRPWRRRCGWNGVGRSTTGLVTRQGDGQWSCRWCVRKKRPSRDSRWDSRAGSRRLQWHDDVVGCRRNRVVSSDRWLREPGGPRCWWWGSRRSTGNSQPRRHLRTRCAVGAERKNHDGPLTPQVVATEGVVETARTHSLRCSYLR